jgi:hypothetical protein
MATTYWIIKSRYETIPHTTEDGFRAALRDLFGDPKKHFVSATLPDGKVLDEAAAMAWLGDGGGFAIGEGRIGVDGLG